LIEFGVNKNGSISAGFSPLPWPGAYSAFGMEQRQEHFWHIMFTVTLYSLAALDAGYKGIE
jgi:hypothetical protein